MIGDVLRVGDEVTITLEAESREWGYNPCPDGTRATVLGFTESTYGRLGNWGRAPGVYENHSWVKLRLADGREHQEWDGRLTLVGVDDAEYQRRVDAWREAGGIKAAAGCIRPLPATLAWEGDWVEVRGERYIVQRINYDWTPRVYDISDSLDAGWHTMARDGEMKLLERGNVWKYEHGEPLSFADVREEATFFQRMGHTESVRNPANGLYKWTGVTGDGRRTESSARRA